MNNGIKIIKEESKIKVKDGKHYEEFTSIVELTPEQHLANYYISLRNKLGLLTRKLNSIKQMKNILLSFEYELDENLNMTDKMIAKYEATYNEIVKFLKDKKIQNRMISDKPISYNEYKKKRKEIIKAIKEIKQDIKKEFEELQQKINEVDI